MPPPEQQRRDRLLRVLRTAGKQTRYARDYGTDFTRFEDLPAVDLLSFLRHKERYTVERAKAVSERLHYPLGDAPRTAVVGRRVEESRRVRNFPRLQCAELTAYSPQALAGPLDAFRAASGDPESQPPLRNAVIVFTGILEGPMKPADGDALWRRYRVPVFEQFLGLGGELMAWECEIHHGLHVREESAHFESGEGDRLIVSFLGNPRLPLLRLETGLTGRLLETACPCGAQSPRLVDVRRRTVGRSFAGQSRAAAVS